jgi:hypothetical protein
VRLILIVTALSVVLILIVAALRMTLILIVAALLVILVLIVTRPVVALRLLIKALIVIDVALRRLRTLIARRLLIDGLNVYLGVLIVALFFKEARNGRSASLVVFVVRYNLSDKYAVNRVDKPVFAQRRRRTDAELSRYKTQLEYAFFRQTLF